MTGTGGEDAIDEAETEDAREGKEAWLVVDDVEEALVMAARL